MNRKQKVAVVVGVMVIVVAAILVAGFGKHTQSDAVLAHSGGLYHAVVRAPSTGTDQDLQDALLVLVLNDDHNFVASLVVPDLASRKALEGTVLPSGKGTWASDGDDVLLTYGNIAQDDGKTPPAQRLHADGVWLRVAATGGVLKPTVNPRMP